MIEVTCEQPESMMSATTLIYVTEPPLLQTVMSFTDYNTRKKSVAVIQSVVMAGAQSGSSTVKIQAIDGSGKSCSVKISNPYMNRQ